MQEFHLAEKFLIIVTNDTQNYTRSLDEVFELLWRNGLINSHILIKDENSTWNLNTFSPYQNGCFALSHLKLASFTQSDFSHTMMPSIDRMYPNKLRNFNGCPIYIAVSLVSPFTIFQNTSDGRNQFKGIEIFIVNQISKKYNFTAVYKRSSIDTDNGTVLKNGTVTGNMGLVLKCSLSSVWTFFSFSLKFQGYKRNRQFDGWCFDDDRRAYTCIIAKQLVFTIFDGFHLQRRTCSYEPDDQSHSTVPSILMVYSLFNFIHTHTCDTKNETVVPEMAAFLHQTSERSLSSPEHVGFSFRMTHSQFKHH